MGEDLPSDLDRLGCEIAARISGAPDEAALEAERISALGKKGSISSLLKRLGSVDAKQRRDVGSKLNRLRDRLKKAYVTRRSELQSRSVRARIESEQIDVSLPVRHGPLFDGRIHPVSHVIDEISSFFVNLGFDVATGPDIETDDSNFTALNFPDSHPAREMHDTFFLRSRENEDISLLRTHTSPVQIHVMRTRKPPLRIIAPGRAYRRDSDQTHTPVFHQLEGLVVDENSHLGHMKWLLETFCRTFFGVETLKMRFRPSFFPFTEPSLEADINCSRDGGRIRLGEGNEWLEILGCGMVHPNVLRNCRLDPEQFQGFAWGLGIDRIAMLKYGMPDLRAFFESDIRWLKHYGFRPLDLLRSPGGRSQ